MRPQSSSTCSHIAKIFDLLAVKHVLYICVRDGNFPECVICDTIQHAVYDGYFPECAIRDNARTIYMIQLYQINLMQFWTYQIVSIAANRLTNQMKHAKDTCAHFKRPFWRLQGGGLGRPSQGVPVPLFPWNNLVCSPDPQKPKFCFLVFPVPQCCLCSPVPFKNWPEINAPFPQFPKPLGGR